ncbi:MAG: hypothetical protein KJ046_03940 [Anaerolineae bacterium]|nr:hypothetical protein [Anaerolineae bacterium]RIK24143.1 MAG: hypothetical protein DCC51_01300 [Anaerolineae bacterium]
MDIRFYNNPLEEPRAREDVRFRQIGLFIHPDLRRMAFGVELTPFRERPSIAVTLINSDGEPAGSLHIIETFTPNMSLTMHFRDAETKNPYTLVAVLYYTWPEQEEKQLVERRELTFEVLQTGEQIFKFEK